MIIVKHAVTSFVKVRSLEEAGLYTVIGAGIIRRVRLDLLQIENRDQNPEAIFFFFLWMTEDLNRSCFNE